MRRLIPAVALLTLACGGPAPDAPPPEAPPADTVTVGERVPFPFATLIETAPVPLLAGGEIGVSAAVCGGCHTDIAAEWQASTHAQAMADGQYLAELAKPNNPRWLCLSCHRPLQAQAAVRQQPGSLLLGAHERSVGALAAKANPGHQPALIHEAITCATCHVRVASDGRGTILGPRGDTTSPHRVTVDRPGLHGVCERCHTPGTGHLTPSFACWFETHGELAAGPQRDRDCVDCHMPTATRPLAAGGPVRTTRRHTWAGGGVPKRFADYSTLLARGWKPGITVQVDRPEAEGAGWRVAITLENTHGGHAVPTGDPERHLRIIARTGSHRWQQHLGQVWDWGDDATGRPARRLTDTRLRPGERRTLVAHLPARPAADVVVEVAHVRLSPENLRHARGATLDAELKALRPQAQAVVAELERHYPTFTWIHRTRWAPGAATPIIVPLAELLAESAQPRALTTLDATLGTGVAATP
ncbi:MAG: hypothetical protein H6702_10470 [Myxococcales bacterium]|nr:hypothetical protein [Myxococcales bacterium]